MSRYFVGLQGRTPDEGLLLLEEIFNLDDQLQRLAETQSGQGETR